MKQVCVAQKLKSFEIVGNTRLIPIEWTPENGYLSSSRKIKRNPIKEEWGNLYEEMYAQGRRRF